uniref:Uncharacterized protein n=1 Tax=Rhizophora mucronata TaxID=61149 RepID=A0A2P2KC58_RHIMU
MISKVSFFFFFSPERNCVQISFFGFESFLER